MNIVCHSTSLRTSLTETEILGYHPRVRFYCSMFDYMIIDKVVVFIDHFSIWLRDQSNRCLIRIISYENNISIKRMREHNGPSLPLEFLGLYKPHKIDYNDPKFLDKLTEIINDIISSV